MSGCEDEWVSLLEEPNRSCGLATAAAALQITQLLAGQRVVVTRRGALGRFFCCLLYSGLER